MGREVATLTAATVILVTATLLTTATSGDAGYHRILVGASSASLCALLLVIYQERRRPLVVDAVAERIREKLEGWEQCIQYGIKIGRDLEREEHVVEPVVLHDWRKARQHCPPGCSCREDYDTAAPSQADLVSMSSRGIGE